jgi:hypothetical protein
MTYSSNSLLRKSNQAWKLQAMFLAISVSAVLMIFAKWQIDALTPESFTAVMLSGVAIGLSGLAFACLTIKCPHCETRWLWRAVSKQHSGNWLHWLQSQESCPACGAYSREAA